VNENSDTDSDTSTIMSEPPSDDCEPPVTRAPRRRPPKKPKRNGEKDVPRKKGKDQAVQRAPSMQVSRTLTTVFLMVFVALRGV
jgi:hypothetical protein